MPHLFLSEGGQNRGKFELPREIRGEDGGCFRLGTNLVATRHGAVFEARCAKGTCAVKFMTRQDDITFDRFKNEVRIMRMLDHQYIAKFFDSGEIVFPGDYRGPWIAMELGESNLREHVQKKGVIGPESLISVSIQICEALGHVHSKRIIHRDIKPENFVVLGTEIRMIDFGIAKLIGEDVFW